MAGDNDAAPLPPRRPGTQRRQASSGERIDEILETALQRAECMDPRSLTLIRKQSKQTARRMAAADYDGDGDGDGDGDDETTGMVARGSGQGYQSLQISSGGDTTRSRKSILYANGRKSETAATRSQPSAHGSRCPGSEECHAPAEPTPTPPPPPPPRWRQTLAKFQSIDLENKGSVARDHLALERTFLAWLRTSLAFASIGVAVTQLFRLDTSIADAKTQGVDRTRLRQMGRPLGATFLVISIVTLLLGCKRYFHAQEWILKGKFPASRGTIIIMAFVALALMLLSLVVVIVIHPTDGEQ